MKNSKKYRKIMEHLDGQYKVSETMVDGFVAIVNELIRLRKSIKKLNKSIEKIEANFKALTSGDLSLIKEIKD